MKEMRPQQLSELVAFLEDLARRRAATVTYGDIAHRFQLPELTDVWSTHPLAPVFDNLDAQDHDMERPFRTTLVVNADRLGLPGSNYFDSLARRRSIRAKSRLDQFRVHRQELQALYDYYRHNRPMVPAQVGVGLFLDSGLNTEAAQVYAAAGTQPPKNEMQKKLLRLFAHRQLWLSDVQDLDGFVIEQLVLARLDPDLLFDDPFTPTQKLKDSYKRVGNGVRNLVDAIKKEDLGSHRPTLYHSTLSKRLRKSLDGRAPEIEPGAVKELWEAYINSLMQDLRLLQAIAHAVQRQSAARSIRENRSIALAVAEHIFYRIVSYHQYDLKKQSFAAPTKKVLRDLTYDIWCLYMPAHRNEISSDQVDKIGRKKTR